MFRKFTIAAIVVAFGFAVFGQVGGLRSNEDDALPGAAVADPGVESVTEGLNPVMGRKPLPEIIAFWQRRADDHPLDYLSRTELGLALNTAAAESADLDRYAEAERVLQEALDLNQEHRPARLGLASALIARHDFTGALEQTQLVLNERPGSLPALALTGDASIGIGDIDQASDAYGGLLEQERSAATVSRLARLRWAEGQPAAAVAAAEEALELGQELALRPNAEAFYHFQLGHFLFVTGEVDRAIASYEAALTRDPNHPGASEGLAFALASTGRNDEAATAYAAILDRGPAADLHGHYAEVLIALGDESAAAEQFRLGDALAAATLESNPAERRHLAGYLASRNPELAVQLARTDLEERQDVGAYDTLAWALFNAGRYHEAASMIEQALTFEVQDAGILYHAAAIADAVGDQSLASTRLAKALAINPQFHPTETSEADALGDRLTKRGDA